MTSQLRDKIEDRMKILQMQMEANVHLNSPWSVLVNIENVSKFWSVLSEEDRDYIQAARTACDEGIKWDLP